MLSFNWSIKTDTERVTEVNRVFNTLDKEPTAADLDYAGLYILCGNDETGTNMLDRGEIYNPNKRVSKRKDNKLLSLDDANATPNIDPSQLRSPHERSPYTQKRLRIARPRYAANGQLLDPGDSTIPGMTDLWASIDHLDKWLSICYGHLPPEPHFPLITDSYRIYKMHTLLIELRQTQYFLKDSWNPPIHFTKVDHPKPAFIDWNADSFYWIDENDWTQRIKNALTHTIS